MLKIDLHVHSSYSMDGKISIKEIIKYAKKQKLNGLAITDHNTIKGGLIGLKEVANSNDFIVIPGIEISTNSGHLIGLNLREDIPKHLSPIETKEKIVSLGGICIIPHPYRIFSGIRTKNIKAIDSFDCIEVFNSRCTKTQNKKALMLADKINKCKIGGSDAHLSYEIGRSYTVFETNSYNIDDLIQEIKSKKTNGYGVSACNTAIFANKIRAFMLILKRGKWI